MYQPKTGFRCSCKPGVMRDNCSKCEGTGHLIDFAAIRESNKIQPAWDVHNSKGTIVGVVHGASEMDALESADHSPEFDKLDSFTVRKQ